MKEGVTEICIAPEKLRDRCDFTRYKNVTDKENDFPECASRKPCIQRELSLIYDAK